MTGEGRTEGGRDRGREGGGKKRERGERAHHPGPCGSRAGG